MKSTCLNKSIKSLLVLGFVLGTGIFLGACSSTKNPENKPVELSYLDITGFYRVLQDPHQAVPSITSVQVIKGNTENETSVRILRNGLSHQEYHFYGSRSPNLISWADSKYGREIVLDQLNDGQQQKNKLDEQGNAVLDLCGSKDSLGQSDFKVQYCLNFKKEKEGDQADLKLSLLVFNASGEQINEFESESSVFNKYRLAVDYFGNWSGKVILANNYYYTLRLETQDQLFVTFQPVNNSEYILRPLDTDQRIYLGRESFVLEPINRPLEELETNANPYINFRYISEQNANRKIIFRSFVRDDNQIEGNIVILNQNEEEWLLGHYNLSRF